MRLRPVRALLRDTRGVSAVEFAVIAPFMILMLFAGYAVTQAVAVSRKVTLTTRALADLTSQYSTLSSDQMTQIKNAATQIIAPFDSSVLSLRITQITMTSVAGVTVGLTTWSTATNKFKPNPLNLTIQLPTGMPNTLGLTYILAETSYTYTPPFFNGSADDWYFNYQVDLGSRIFMLPRVSAAVAYSGS